MKHWFFLTDAWMKQLAQDMSGNTLANSLIHTSENMSTPLGVVFDFWNNEDEEKALALLDALKSKVEIGILNKAANRLEMYLFAIQHMSGELLESYNQWLNKNGLQVESLLAGFPSS